MGLMFAGMIYLPKILKYFPYAVKIPELKLTPTTAILLVVFVYVVIFAIVFEFIKNINNE